MAVLDLSDSISAFDYDQIVAVLGGWREPDFTIAPQGVPYLHRWYLIPRRVVGANVYLHLQVADDPDRPLHDHPWDNQSVVLAGGYRETHQHVYRDKLLWTPAERDVHAGATIHRRATEAHRLKLLSDYSISVFSTGPILRDWGFWGPGGWRKAISDRQETTS